MFDVLENDFGIGYELIMTFDDEKQEQLEININDQVKDIGYESHNAVKLLGTTAFILGF